MNKLLAKYKSRFSLKTWWNFLPAQAKRMGHKAVYSALLLYNAYQQPDTPHWAKSIILGALGYLLTPIDALPDLTPILGFTDDLGILSFGLVTVACYVDQDVRQTSRTKLTSWFNEVSEEDLNSVDRQL